MHLKATTIHQFMKIKMRTSPYLIIQTISGRVIKQQIWQSLMNFLDRKYNSNASSCNSINKRWCSNTHLLNHFTQLKYLLKRPIKQHAKILWCKWSKLNRVNINRSNMRSIISPSITIVQIRTTCTSWTMASRIKASSLLLKTKVLLTTKILLTTKMLEKSWRKVKNNLLTLRRAKMARAKISGTILPFHLILKVKSPIISQKITLMTILVKWNLAWVS